MNSREMKEPIKTRPVELDTRREVPKHRQCPLCHDGKANGVGRCDGTYKKSSSLTRRYYRCDKCGHTWIVNFTPEQVKTLKE